MRRTLRCRVCGELFGALNSHLRSHGLTAEEYKKKYPGARVVTRKRASEISVSKLGVKQDPDVVAHRALANTGRKCSEETKAKIGAANKGKKPRLGMKNSPEHNAKIRARALGRPSTCRMPEKEARRKVRALGIQILGEYTGISNPVKLRGIECGHTWTTKIQSLLHYGSRCPTCAHSRRVIPEADIRERLIRMKMELVGGYKNATSHVRLKCTVCGPKWDQRREVTRSCPNCTPQWKTEKAVRDIFERLTGWKFPKIRPPWLKGRNSHPLELDGYNEKYAVAFEYQGEQHYEVMHFQSSQDFEELKRNDERKRQLCKYHGVLLIRIPYWKKDPEFFIRTKLERAGLL